VIWSPRKCDIIAIENVQRKFSKRLPGFSEYSYSHRLSLLEIHSLELSRLHFDLIYCYKVIFGLTGIHCTDLFERRSDCGTRGHPYKIFKHHCTCTARFSFFSERVVDSWNTLPPSKVDFYSRDAMLARVIAIATCLSVCLSRAGIVSKRRKLAA